MATTPAPVPTHTASSVLDHACVVAGFAAAACVASLLGRLGLFVWPGPERSDVAGWPEPYVVLLLASLVLWTAVSAYTGIYRAPNGVGRPGTFRRLWRTIAYWAAATTAALFFFKLHVVSRQFSVTFYAVTSCLITVRALAEATLAKRWDGSNAERWAIVVGSPSERRTIVEALVQSREFPPGSVRELDPGDVEACAGDPVPRGGGARDGMRRHAFVVTAGLDGTTAEGLVLGLLRHRWCVHMVPALMDTRLFRYSVDELGGTPAIRLEVGRLGPAEAALKRGLDVAGAAVGLVLLAPILGLIAAAIRLTSPGPALFTQPRIGRDGARFRMYKFRSMRIDAEQILAGDPELYAKYVANNFKIPKDDDFRVTRIGRFLRATSLDELPQLWNVFVGEMSLVGPRPVVPDEIARYGEFASLLVSVKPGMTGHWQTSGRSRVAEYSRRVFLDMEYVRDQSLRTDLEILVRTVGKVARREGSY